MPLQKDLLKKNGEQEQQTQQEQQTDEEYWKEQVLSGGSESTGNARGADYWKNKVLSGGTWTPPKKKTVVQQAVNAWDAYRQSDPVYQAYQASGYEGIPGMFSNVGYGKNSYADVTDYIANTRSYLTDNAATFGDQYQPMMDSLDYYDTLNNYYRYQYEYNLDPTNEEAKANYERANRAMRTYIGPYKDVGTYLSQAGTAVYDNPSAYRFDATKSLPDNMQNAWAMHQRFNRIYSDDDMHSVSNPDAPEDSYEYWTNRQSNAKKKASEARAAANRYLEDVITPLEEERQAAAETVSPWEKQDELDAAYEEYYRLLGVADSLDADVKKTEEELYPYTAITYTDNAKNQPDYRQKVLEGYMAYCRSVGYEPQQERYAMVEWAKGNLDELPEDVLFAGMEVIPYLHGDAREKNAAFYYLYATNPELAQDLYARKQESYADQLNYNIYKWAGQNTFTRAAAAAANIFFYPAKALEGTVKMLGGGQDARGNSATKTLNALQSGGAAGLEEKGLFNTGLLSGEIDESIPFIGGLSLGDAYGLGISMGQSLMNRGFFGTMGTIALGLSAASDAYDHAKETGASDSEAWATGFTQGLWEALSEYFSLDNLVKMDVDAAWWKNALEQAGIEASEEFCSSLATAISDPIIRGEDSDFNREIRRMITEEGMTYDEACKAASLQFARGLFQDALGGFVSGGFMTAGEYAFNGASSWHQRRSAETQFYDNMAKDGTADVLASYLSDNGKTFNIDSTRSIKRTEAAAAEIMEGRFSAAKTAAEAQSVYDEISSQYGDKIESTAMRAWTASVSERFGKAKTTEQLEAAYNELIGGKKITSKSTDLEKLAAAAYFDAAMKLSKKQKGTTAESVLETALKPYTASKVTTDTEAAFVREDGTEVHAQVVSMNDKGELVLDDGTAVSVKDAIVSTKTQAVLNAVQVIGGKTGALFFEQYLNYAANNPSVDGADYIAALHDAYLQGMSAGAEGRQASFAKRTSNILTEAAYDYAYNLGVDQADTETMKQVEKINRQIKEAGKGATGRVGSVTFAKNVDTTTKNAKRALTTGKIIAQAAGVDVRLVKGSGQMEGSYHNGVLTLDIDQLQRRPGETVQGAILRVASHELTHFIQDKNAADYKALKNFCFNHILQAHTQEEINRQRDAIIDANETAGKKLSQEGAIDEMVANACEQMLLNSDILSELYKQNATLGQKVTDWVGKFFSTMRQNIGKGARSKEAAWMSDAMDELQEKWEAALRVAAENQIKLNSAEGTKNTATEVGGRVQYSLADASIPTYEELVAKKPLKIVNIKEGITSASYADMKSATLEKAKTEEWYEKPHLNDDTDSFIFLTEKSFTHAFSNLTFEFGEDTIRCMAHIPEVIKEAYLVSVDDPKDASKRETKVYVFFGAVDGINGVEPVKLTVKEFDYQSADSLPQNIRAYFEKNGIMDSYTSLYDAKALEVIGVEGIKIEPDASVEGGEKVSLAQDTSDSSITVADLLALVKGDAQKYIPAKARIADDADYLSVAEKYRDGTATEEETEQLRQAVEAAAKKAGYTNRMFHGSKSGGGFTVFKGWQYFTENEAYAKRYTKGGNGDGLYSAFVKADNLFDTRKAADRKVFNQYRMEYGMGELQQDGLPDWTDGYDLSEIIEENNLPYDGIVLNEGGDIVDGKPVSRGHSYVIRDSAQIKSADLVTYDDNGEIIPLSERFNSQNNDIRYSAPLGEDALDIGEAEQLTDEDLLWQIRMEDAKDEGERDWLDQAKGRAEKLKDLRAQLAEAKRQMQTTNREMNKKGFSPFVRELAETFGIKDRDMQRTVREQVLDLYQKVQEEIDKGRDAVADRMLTKGAEKIGEWLIDHGYTAEKFGRKWTVTDFAKQFARTAEDRARIVNDVTFKLMADFYNYRYREAVQMTQADRLVQQTKEKYTGKLTQAREELLAAQSENAKLTKKNEYLRNVQDHNDYMQIYIRDQTIKLQNAIKEVENAGRVNEKQQKKIENLKQTLREAHAAKRAWEAKSKHAASVMQSALNSKNADIANLEKQIARYERMLDGDLRNPKLQRLLREARTEAEKKTAARKDQQMQDYRERKKRTEIMHKIEAVKDMLNKRLMHPTTEKHIPPELSRAVVDFLETVNADAIKVPQAVRSKADGMWKIRIKLGGDTYTVESSTEQGCIEKARTLKLEYQNRTGEAGTKRASLDRIAKLYEDIKNDTEYYSAVYDENVRDMISEVKETVGGRALYELGTAELQDVYTAIRALTTVISNANKAFIENRNMTISEMAMASINFMQSRKGKQYRAAFMDNIKGTAKKAFWNNLKPVYAFRMLGDETLQRLFDNVRRGEDVWAVDIEDAKAFFDDAADQYGYKKWDFKKSYKFEDKTGKTFSLTLQQMLSLYAYSRREQAAEHLAKGGIVFEKNSEIVVEEGTKKKTVKFNTDDAYPLSVDVLAEIAGTLTDEQKKFAVTMQDYLSDVMGGKGNEVTMQLYGIRRFGEKYYFPLKSSDKYIFDYEQKQNVADPRIKNSGFTKDTVKNASNPIVVQDFMDVWAEHVNRMSQYHALVLPLEDFNRVYGWKHAFVIDEENGVTVNESVRASIGNAWGDAPIGYINQLLKDLNGSVVTDNAAGLVNKGLSLFKKGSVFASLSVVIQQPSAVARAMAYIPEKYFVGKTAEKLSGHKSNWEQCKKYAPVAIIKEMGYFDVGMGQSTVDYLKTVKPEGFKEKLGAVFTDSAYRDELLSKAPALADELTWTEIWKAAKRMAAATTDLKGEALLQKAGEIFTEAIVNTQVYDSVLSRSALMRSKDTGMKMATAFMAEPTTSANMLIDAIVQGKRGNKKFGALAVKSVASSIIINSILSALVYAMRDDDDDETYLEKYLEAFVSQLIDGFNPVNMVPFLRDIWSIAEGYDVERSDLSWADDLYRAISNLWSDKLSLTDKLLGVAGAVGNITGLPIKNIYRDAKGLTQTIQKFLNGEAQTGTGIKYALIEGVPDIFGGGKVSNASQLADAAISGDREQYERIAGRYSSGKEAEAKLTAELKIRYDDMSLSREKALELLVQYGGKTENEAYWTVDEWDETKKHKDEDDWNYNKYGVLDECIASGSGVSTAVKALTDHGVKPDTVTSHIRDYVKDAYGDKQITKTKAVRVLTNYGGMTETEATTRVQYWDFKKQYPDADISEEKVAAYYNNNLTLPMSAYITYCTNTKNAHGVDANGDGKTDSGSKKAAILVMIDELPISNAQKDELYYLNGWAASKIYEAPWH